METFERSTEILTAALFAAIALIGAWRGRRGARASRRAGLAFGSLAFVLVLSLLPDTALEPLGSWGGKVIILTLFAFPYLLFRFTEAFHDYPPLIKRAALAGLLIVAATTTAIPITADESESPGMLGYLVVVLFYWTFVSSVTGIQLWGAGRGQPSLARKRMRLMSVATLGLNLVLIFGVVPGGDSNTASVIVQIAVLVTGVSFLLGFSPPRILRYAWREPEETALREAVQQLMKADTLQEVSDLLLPHALALVGASTVELRGPDGEVLASLGAPSGAGTSGDFEEGAHTDLPLTAPNVSILRVWTSRYTPFFGRDDVEALSGLAAVADLAFERCRLFEVERELRATADASREEAERANLAKSEFLARMSHELRTPLNVILGFAQILETSDLIEEDREAVAHMIKAGHHLLELINEVLDLSRIESGRLSISVEPVQADDIVRESLSLIQPVAAERGITIHEDLSECDVFVHADRQRSKQVLLNLLSNAVKYNRDKGQIIVSGGRSGDRLFVTVSDTGPGLPEGSADKLFQPFERL
ncbi:MAG TPA: HAMP domain-containing sensor histidine kinase, partial [Actinomycetota bacterium]|nr:HAMP domain-containing sensor histidine kinase [Actinomycetota bacterium]